MQFNIALKTPDFLEIPPGRENLSLEFRSNNYSPVGSEYDSSSGAPSPVSFSEKPIQWSVPTTAQGQSSFSSRKKKKLIEAAKELMRKNGQNPDDYKDWNYILES
jgi:hypothetical protein